MYYQVGGGLSHNSPSYVQRKADQQLYDLLKQGQFCYVLNSRQMGKSSLLIKTRSRLQQEGYKCNTIDITNLGSENITPTQWYKGIVTELWRGFQLVHKFDLKTWWQENQNISLVQRLSHFIENVLLTELPTEKIVIFVDEIDSILSLNFPVDDFFALIRFFYNYKAINPEFHRLTFALFGVATPSDLIQDRKRTPFNIGKAIELEGFTLDEIQPLAAGLKLNGANINKILEAVLFWTNGQPFLTQKICDLILNYKEQLNIASLVPGKEEFWVENIVKEKIIDKWESQDEPEHLRTIKDRLFSNPQTISSLLFIYQQLLEGQQILGDDSQEQTELILSGLVVNQQGRLTIKNRIYALIFDITWVTNQLDKIRPYLDLLLAWEASQKTDESRLLTGTSLKIAQTWAQDKHLKDLDYQFLKASAEREKQENEIKLQADRALEINARLALEKKANKQQRFLLRVISFALMMTTILVFIAYNQYQQASISEISALVSASEGNFDSNRHLKALILAIQAKKNLSYLSPKPAKLEYIVERSLEKAVYGADEYNSLEGSKGTILALEFSPDQQIIASAGTDNTIKIWQRDGKLIKTFEGHQATVRTLSFSPNGQLIASASDDRTIKLWKIDGTLVKTFPAQSLGIWGLDFGPKGDLIASTGIDGVLKLWRLDGSLVKTIKTNQPFLGVAFSPDNQLLATGNGAGVLELWTLDGTLVNTFKGHSGWVADVDFSPDGKMIASASYDQTAKIWKRDGNLIMTLTGHTSNLSAVDFSPDSQTIATASADNTVKLWKIDGTLINTFKGHNSFVTGLDFSADGNLIASSSSDQTIKLWKTKNPFVNSLKAHESALMGVSVSADSQIIATGGHDGLVKLWNTQGTLLNTFNTKPAIVIDVSISPDGSLIAAALDNKTIKLWDSKGILLHTLQGHQGSVLTLAFSHQSNLIASAGVDTTIKLWQRDGTLLKTLKTGNTFFWGITFSPNDQIIGAAGADGTVQLWQTNGTLLKTFKAHQNALFEIVFSSDGKYLATASADNTVKLWNLNGNLITTLETFQGAVWAMALSPDQRLIATGAVDKTIKLWQQDLHQASWHLNKVLTGHTSNIRNIAFTPDNQHLVSVGYDGTLLIWNIPEILKVNLLDYACAWTQDYFRNSSQSAKHDDFNDKFIPGNPCD